MESESGYAVLTSRVNLFHVLSDVDSQRPRIPTFSYFSDVGVVVVSFSDAGVIVSFSDAGVIVVVSFSDASVVGCCCVLWGGGGGGVFF